MLPFFLALLLSLPCAAWAPIPRLVETGTRTATGYDSFFFDGWNDGCSVSLRYFNFAPTGTAMEGVPVSWLVGSLSIYPDDPRVHEDWLYKGDAWMDWKRWRAEEAAKALQKGGYIFPGRTERLIPSPPAKEPGPDETIIHSTASFQLADPADWPPERFRLQEIRYSPLGTCVFLVFKDPGKAMDSRRFRLIRIQNPGVRRMRSYAHMNHGLLLYQRSDIYGAVDELAIAAGMDPENGLARYHHSALLVAHGRMDEAMGELKAAISMEPRCLQMAQTAVEFESVRTDPRFKALMASFSNNPPSEEKR